MGLVTIDVAKESTLQDVYSKVKDGAGIWCNPCSSITDSNIYIDKFLSSPTSYFHGLLTNANGNIILNFRNEIYIVREEDTHKGGIIKVNNGYPSLGRGYEIPFSGGNFNINEIAVVVYKDEVHILGGRLNGYNDNASIYGASHYAWDGENWRIASTIPYPFVAGKAIVYQDKIHILGGGTGSYTNTDLTQHLNFHYSWDGELWKKESDLPYPSFGITPIVIGGKLHIIGGETNSTVNYGKNHYVWDGISWSKTTDLADSRFNASVAKVSDTEIYLIGGRNKGNGENNKVIMKFNGTTWSDTGYRLDDYTTTDTANSVAFTRERDILVSGKFISKFNPKTGLTKIHKTPITLTNGDIILYRNKLHLFQDRSHYEFDVTNGWVLLPEIPYRFSNGAVVVHNNEIHLIGTDVVGFEDYYYTWSPEKGWTNQTTLPWKFNNGSAVVYNGEIHLIGGSLNSKTYNHYKYSDKCWIPVSHTHYDVIGKRGAVVFDNKLCIITCYGSGGTVTNSVDNAVIYAFDGAGWNLLANDVNPGDITKKTGEKAFTLNKAYGCPKLIVYRNRLHVLAVCTNPDNEEEKRICHIALTNSGANKSANAGFIQYMRSNVISDVLPIVFNDYICKFVNGEGLYDGGMQYARTDFETSRIWGMEIYLPANHLIICDKNIFYPISGEVEDTKEGYKTLSTGKYIFGFSNNCKPNEISFSVN